MCSECNQAKQSYARMTDIMERGKIDVLIIAHKKQQEQIFAESRYIFLRKQKGGAKFR